MEDQFSFEAGYARGLTGELPAPGDYPRRFAYVNGWAKGYRVFVASLEPREVNLW